MSTGVGEEEWAGLFGQQRGSRLKPLSRRTGPERLQGRAMWNSVLLYTSRLGQSEVALKA